MSDRHDREHFTDYTDQNKTKHKILTDYYKQYLAILSRWAKRFHFIDAFAGQGHYEGDHPGSPLLALDVMAKAKVLERSTISCVEKQSDFAEQLRQTLTQSPHKRLLLAEDLVLSGSFHDHVDAILSREIYKSPGKVASFAFVDPCGVAGVRIQDLVRLLRLDYGEILLLFNSDGVNRLLGGEDKGTVDDKILVDLFGLKQRVDEVQADLLRRPSERELVILEKFSTAIGKDSDAQYILRFRFKAKTSDRSSHYLMHFSNHPLAFKIMKSVMWAAGKSEQDAYGRLEFLSDHERGSVMDLFRMDLQAPRASILEELRSGHRKVSQFTDTWVCRPTDDLSAEVYRKLLLDQESEGKILVYDKLDQEPAPASKRRKVLGKTTLADEYWLRLP